MLQLSVIREQREGVISALKKRRIPNIEQTIDQVLTLDQDRRRTQQEHDELLAESNRIAREIGELRKSGGTDIGPQATSGRAFRYAYPHRQFPPTASVSNTKCSAQ